MEKNLDRQIAIVTGASRGIGRAIAIELARQGAKVIGTATSETARRHQRSLQRGRLGGRGVVLDVNDAALPSADRRR